MRGEDLMSKKKSFSLIRMTHDEWRKEAIRRFGPNIEDWKFVCPGCGNIASGRDFKDVGAEPNSMYQECIGRYRGGIRWANKKKNQKGPCDYAGYGLFNICPVIVVRDDGVEISSFAFAEGDLS